MNEENTYTCVRERGDGEGKGEEGTGEQRAQESGMKVQGRKEKGSMNRFFYVRES